MIAFANPWAWVGALALALPIAVHLLRRHRAARRSFPTLRFLPEARVVAVRRHRPTDVPLMLIRLAIVAAAVVALAQPIWRDAAAARAAGPQLSRAVVIDRSPGMARPSDDGRPLAQRADEEVDRLANVANQVLIDATDLRAGLLSAAGWAARQTGPREVIVVSSFPLGSLDSTDIAALSKGVGIKFLQLALKVESQIVGPFLEARGDHDTPRSLTPRLTLAPGETAVSWDAADATRTTTFIDWRVRAEDRLALGAATAASFDVGVAALPADRAVVVVLPDAPDRAALSASAVPIDAVWMFDVIHELSRSPLLTSLARTMSASAPALPMTFTPIVQGARGDVLLAGGRLGSGAPQLLLVSNAPVSTVFTAALSTAIADATHAADWNALEPSSIPEDQLTRWQRPTDLAAPATPSFDGAPVGRWLWVVALVFLGVEWWWRRRPEPAAATPEVSRRVA